MKGLTQNTHYELLRRMEARSSGQLNGANAGAEQQ